MSDAETRSVARDSLFLLATVRIEDEEDGHRVRVRNLSDGGMMAEGAMNVQRGLRLEIELRSVGKVSGSVAWVQDKRFGIAFDKEIDSNLARKPAQVNDVAAASMLERSWAHRAPAPPDPTTLRKV